MTHSDYSSRAELYLGSTSDTALAQGPRSFRTAAHAIRFAVEEAAPVSLHGARLVIGDTVFSGADLIRLAKEKNGALTYGSVGIGSAPHLAGEMFSTAAGIKMLHVPYRGGAPALNDLIAGHLNTMMTSAVISKGQIEAGRLTPIAVAAKTEIVIRRGDPVMVEATQAGFSISREAIAQGDAAAGQRFLAKADGDKTAFQAIAIDSGRATLPGWPGTN